MSQKDELMISRFVGVTVIVSLLVMSALLLVAFFMDIPIKISTAIVAILLLTLVFALVTMIVGFILKRFSFRLDSIFKYLSLFILGVVSTFIIIGVLELGFVTYTPSVLIGLVAVSMIFGIIITISGKFGIPKQ